MKIVWMMTVNMTAKKNKREEPHGLSLSLSIFTLFKIIVNSAKIRKTAESVTTVCRSSTKKQ